MRPFEAMGMTTVSPNNTGGTDHQSFDAVGLPGFQFIQDPLEYDSRTHHSNMDVWDRVQQADLKQMVAVVSTFVYQAANREQMFPRKPLPTAGCRRTWWTPRRKLILEAVSEIKNGMRCKAHPVFIF